MPDKSIENNYPRVDAELVMARLRVAEVKEAQHTLHVPTPSDANREVTLPTTKPVPASELPARAPVLPVDGRPTAVDNSARHTAVLPQSKPSASEPHGNTLPDARPQAADATVTNREPIKPPPLPAPAARAPVLPLSAPQADDHAPLLPTATPSHPQTDGHLPSLPSSAPTESAPGGGHNIAFGAGPGEGFQIPHMVDWRAGPQTRR